MKTMNTDKSSQTTEGTDLPGAMRGGDVEYDRFDTRYTREITCPWCGHEVGDSWEAADEDHVICDACELEFKYTRDVDVTYVSERVGNAENKPKKSGDM